MAMNRRLWSVNALSVELEIDRRTLSRRLDGLVPAKKRRVGNREERSYLLSDVIAHLNREQTSSQADQDERAKGVKLLKDFCREMLFPALLESNYFRGILYNGSREELGLDDTQSRRILDFGMLALVFGIGEIFDDENIGFVFPESWQGRLEEARSKPGWPGH